MQTRLKCALPRGMALGTLVFQETALLQGLIPNSKSDLNWTRAPGELRELGAVKRGSSGAGRGANSEGFRVLSSPNSQ